jgi:hypothetical protein
MKKYTYILFLLLVISCEDAFETVIEIDTPEYTPKLVLESQIAEGDTSVLLRLSRNTDVFDKEDDWLVNDADVTLSINDKIYALNIFTTGNYFNYHVTLDQSIMAGDQISIEASHPDFNTIKASGTIPVFVDLNDINFEEDGGVDIDGEKQSKVELAVDDPMGRNFYQVKLRYVYDSSNSFYYNPDIYCLDPAVSDSYNYESLLIEDEGFDGENKVFDIILDQILPDEDQGELYLVWSVVSEDFFKYSKTRMLNTDQEGNPFSSPVSVWTNVEDGVGILSLTSRREFRVF